MRYKKETEKGVKRETNKRIDNFHTYGNFTTKHGTEQDTSCTVGGAAPIIPGLRLR